MRIKNKTNGKEIEISQKQFDSMSRVAKSNYEVLNTQDAAKDEQVVKSSTAGAKTASNRSENKHVAPDNGEKK